MPGPFWGPIPDANAAFDSFFAQLGDNLKGVRAGDYWQILGSCPSCSAALGHMGASAHITSLPKLPPLFEFLLAGFKDELTKGAGRCSGCDTVLGFSSVSRCYIARVAPLLFSALVGVFERRGEAWALEKYCTFRPPDVWQDLGASPTNNAMAKAWGRSIHPAASARSLLMRLQAGEERPVLWISSEAVLTVQYANESPDGRGMGKACREAGLQAPYLFLLPPPGGGNPVVEMAGGKEFEDVLSSRGAQVATVYSLARIREKIEFWSRAYWIPMRIDQVGRVDLSVQGRPHSFTLDELAADSSGRGFTVDETLFDLGFFGLPLPGAEMSEPPMPAVSDSALLKPATISAGAGTLKPAVSKVPAAGPRWGSPPGETPRGAPLATVASPARPDPKPTFPPVSTGPPPTGFSPSMAAGPQSVCRACGSPAIFVRRMYDSTRLGSLYKPKPVICEKAMNVAVTVMTSCGAHLVPVDRGLLEIWGIPEAVAIGEAARMLEFDSLAVHRRLTIDNKGRRMAGLAGPQAASIATDPRWIENALRAVGVQFPGMIRVECVGENVITFRALEQTLLGPFGKELRKITQSWGLVEPRIASTWSKTFSRQNQAAGGVVVIGDV